MHTTVLSVLAGASLVSAWTEIHHKAFMNKNVDAIVVPGTYTSHMHTFFGSDAITKDMPTSADLQKGCYSGENPNDLSAYWTPTLYYVEDGNFIEVPVFRFSTYYNNAQSEIAIPQDFAMVSGNASAKTQAEADHPSNALEWFCEGSDERESDIAKFPTSTCDQHLQVSLRFPDCVNPDNIAEYDFSDDSNKCPDDMKSMPQLRYAARYDTKSVLPDGWSGDAPFQLSCGDTPGNGYCFHGDFINGWFEDAAENMLAAGGGGYDDGQFISGEHGSETAEDTCTPTDQDPDNGTSDYFTSVDMMNGGSADTVDSPATASTTQALVASSTISASVSTSSAATASKSHGKHSSPHRMAL
ncbi:DUF1996 domain-containing protein [Aspergillus melleus]|uniref:DUF1996 domain-containing protein n=1 Tax=Aspergillus melleus TaxID=138277 RepID=UPI001E8D63D3|nr:uncharacterized protein LDX57_002492 [Aspergillus melleus]KAH8424749.1 hypothetical protein LDX57_002492 [Aspergillus melleus]